MNEKLWSVLRAYEQQKAPIGEVMAALRGARERHHAAGLEITEFADSLAAVLEKRVENLQQRFARLSTSNNELAGNEPTGSENVGDKT